MALTLIDLPTEAQVLKENWTIEHLLSYVTAMLSELYPILRGSYQIKLERMAGADMIKIVMRDQNIWIAKGSGAYLSIVVAGISWHLPTEAALERLSVHLGPFAAKEWFNSRYSCTA